MSEGNFACGGIASNMYEKDVFGSFIIGRQGPEKEDVFGSFIIGRQGPEKEFVGNFGQCKNESMLIAAFDDRYNASNIEVHIDFGNKDEFDMEAVRRSIKNMLSKK